MLKVQKMLRDIPCEVLPAKIIQAFWQLLLPGFVSSEFLFKFYGDRYYLAELDNPTMSGKLGWVVMMVQTMLNVWVNVQTCLEVTSNFFTLLIYFVCFM